MKHEKKWHVKHIHSCEQYIGQAIQHDAHTLDLFGTDFGMLKHSKPVAVCVPETVEVLERLVRYAHEHHLLLTIRGNGLSQCGQALTLPGGLIVCMEKLNKIISHNTQSIWVEANASWADLLHVSLKQKSVPFVVPYNCQLSVGGVLSAGGVGASSFKYGSATAHVDALEVITANGCKQRVAAGSSLFDACLGGQGRFGIITKASIKLRLSAKNVRTFFLVYLDPEPWLRDIQIFKQSADYMEIFCSPSVQGAKLSPKGRSPFAQWLFALHVSVEFDDREPELFDLNPDSNHWKLSHTQDESIESYLFRHDSRFQAMKLTGQWELPHLWYECFVSLEVLVKNLDEILNSLPLYYATVLQIVPIANQSAPGFLMLPESDEIVAVMILNPGLPKPLVQSVQETIKALDQQFLSQGGKRYLSGFLGHDLTPDYWKRHFNNKYEAWMRLKTHYDPQNIFQSVLHDS